MLIGMAAPAAAQGRTVYGATPAEVAVDARNAHGTGERKSNAYMEAAVKLDPATDPAWAALKGARLTAIRVYMNNAYKQKSQKRSAVTLRQGALESEAQMTYVNFAEGWNEVELPAPVEIGETPIYIGARVFETLDALNPYVGWRYGYGDGNCLFKVGNGEWQTFSDRGSLFIQAVTDAPAGTLDGFADATLSSHAGIVRPGETFECRVHLLNHGNTEVKTATLHFDGEGVDRDITVTLDQPAAAREDGSATIEAPAPLTEGLAVPLGISVTALDGKPVAALRALVHPLHISGEEFERIVVVEEFTSLSCVNCPIMYYYLDEALQQYAEAGNKAIYLGRHAGFVKDVFSHPADEALLYLFGSEYPFNPAMMLDRTCFDNARSPIIKATIAATDAYYSSVSYAAGFTAPATLTVVPVNDLATASVGARIQGRVNTATAADMDSVRLSVYLIENGIPEKYYPQTFPDGTPASVTDNYMHNGVIRHVYNTDLLGDLVTVDADGFFSAEYPLALVDLEEVEVPNTELVAVLHRTDRRNVQANKVLNGTSSRFGTADGTGGILSGVRHIAADMQPDVTFTADGSGRIVPSAPLYSIEVYDVRGCGFSPDTPLSPGLYLVRYRTERGASAQSAKVLVR